MNLNLLRRGERLYVCILPKVKDMAEEATKLVPLNIDGTPGELDEGFFTVVCEPITERLGLLSNTELFRKSTKSVVKAREKQTEKSRQEGADTKTETGVNSKDARRIAEAERQEQAGRLVEAYGIYKKLSEANPGESTYKEKVAALWERMSNRTLFGAGNDSYVNPTPSGTAPQTGMETTLHSTKTDIAVNDSSQDTQTLSVTDSTQRAAQHVPAAQPFEPLVVSSQKADTPSFPDVSEDSDPEICDSNNRPEISVPLQTPTRQTVSQNEDIAGQPAGMYYRDEEPEPEKEDMFARLIQMSK